MPSKTPAKREPQHFYKQVEEYQQFVEKNPTVIVGSDSDSYAQHNDTLHVAVCHYASGKRQIVGHWGKLAFIGFKSLKEVFEWYESQPPHSKNLFAVSTSRKLYIS